MSDAVTGFDIEVTRRGVHIKNILSHGPWRRGTVWLTVTTTAPDRVWHWAIDVYPEGSPKYSTYKNSDSTTSRMLRGVIGEVKVLKAAFY
jgi:hypothetical protein